MTTMLEKMCRAMCLTCGLDPDRKFKSSNYGPETAPHEFAWQEYLPEARAALLAIREPDPSVFANPDACFVGFAQIGDEPEENVYLEPDEAAAAFKSVIDAILNQKPETKAPDEAAEPPSHWSDRIFPGLEEAPDGT